MAVVCTWRATPAVITGPIFLTYSNTPYTGTILFRPMSTPLPYTPNLITGGDFRVVPATNGVFSVELSPGNYRVTVGADKAFVIDVPTNNATYTLLERITNSLAWNSAISPRTNSYNIANNTIEGVVRTYTTQASPVVWTTNDWAAMATYLGEYTYTNIAQMVAAPAPIQSPILVKVLGYYTAYDGGGGDFLWDSTRNTVTNLGSVLKSPAPNGRYFALWNDQPGVINVKRFGAKGDKIWDDKPYIQDAIDSFGPAGGTVAFPVGAYRLTSGLTLKPKVTINGPGSSGFYTEDQTSIVKMFAPGTATIFTDNTIGQFALLTVSGTNSESLGYEATLQATLSDGSYATNYPAFAEIKGMTFASVGSDQTNSIFTNNITGIYLDRVTQVKITDCGFVYLTGYPIRAWACNNLTIRDNQFASLGGRGIFIDQTADTTITTTFGGGTIGPVLWLRGNNCSVVNNMLFNNQAPSYYGAQIASVDTATDTITITNNRSPVNAYLRLGDPITFKSNGGTLASPLSENTIYYAIPTGLGSFKVNTQYDQGSSGGALQGVGIDLTTTGSGAPVAELHGPERVVSVNNVLESLWVGNRVNQGWSAGMEVVNSTGITLTGNMIWESGLHNTNYTGAQLLFTQSSNNIISGNYFAKRAATRYAVVGVGFDSLSSQNIVGANSFGTGILTNYIYAGKVGGSLSFNQKSLMLKPDPGNRSIESTTEVNGSAVSLSNFNTTTPGVRISTFAAKGTELAPTALGQFEPIWDIFGNAWNGSTYNSGYARFRALTWEAQTPINAGTYLLGTVSLGLTPLNAFQVDPDTSSSLSSVSLYVDGSLQKIKRDVYSGGLYVGSTQPSGSFFGSPNRFDGYGSGSPEGVITADIGSTWRRINGGAGTTFYVKESGSFNTGWVALGPPGAGGVAASRQILTTHSLTGGGDLSTDRTLSLVNDTASPGANKVYGTDASGVRGWKNDPSGSGGVTDGDKTDITVTGGGLTWTIDPGVVTLGKLANLAQDQFIGRVTASTGVPETATITAAARTVLDDTTTSAMRTTLGLAIGTDVQAQDAELAALASVTSAADTLAYFSGSGTATTTPLTTAGRALIDDASASAQRTTLGLVIGTDVQAIDPELTSIAGLTSAADRVPYYTGSGTAALATFTATGRTLTGATTARAAYDALNGAEATVASATTTDIGAASSDKVSITGTTTITGFGTVAAGTFRQGRFTGALTLTHNATSLILPGAANITTAAGDRFQAYSLGSGNWVVSSYTKADGTAVVGGGGGVSDGDKGDITVSSSGATYTVNNDVVSNAKAANMAASTIKARVTGSTGDPEDATLSQVLDLVGSPANGDMLVRSGGTWGRLPAPTGFFPAQLYNGPDGFEWVNTRTHYIFVEDWIYHGLVGYAGWGTGGSSANIASEAQASGIMGVTTSGSSTGARALTPNSANLVFGEGKVCGQFRVRIPTLSTSGERFTVHIGFMDGESGGTDGAYFRCVDNVAGGNWEAVAESNNSITSTDTGVAATTSWTNFTIVVNAAASEVLYYIDGTLVRTETGATIPSGASRATSFGFGIAKSVGTTQRDFYCDVMSIYKRYTTAR